MDNGLMTFCDELAKVFRNQRRNCRSFNRDLSSNLIEVQAYVISDTFHTSEVSSPTQMLDPKKNAETEHYINHRRVL
jgi:hypothetical protein